MPVCLSKLRMLHAVVVFPRAEGVISWWLEEVENWIPDLSDIDPSSWKVTVVPRPSTFGELESDRWRWGFLFDPSGMSAEFRPRMDEIKMSPAVQSAINSQGAHVIVSLVNGPAEASALERMRALCKMVWSWLDCGATAVIWPEGRLAHQAGTMLKLVPDQISSGHSWLFVSNGVAARRGEALWLRSYGMAQFTLPDILVRLPRNEVTEQELIKVRLLLETLPPAMIEQHGVLPEGGEVTVQGRVFRAKSVPSEVESLMDTSRYGFVFLE